eukprot:TRINITY_DN26046_c0_g1_i1.p1 TRINITY_DN26046_c0_g1~~TRINITY_DN26046_c0_g1_i1.p1  ORF type:complete len:113 (-),score=3.53 TRINITY_DN26046_c0_g1_i1:624-962(-)
MKESPWSKVRSKILKNQRLKKEEHFCLSLFNKKKQLIAGSLYLNYYDTNGATLLHLLVKHTGKSSKDTKEKRNVDLTGAISIFMLACRNMALCGDPCLLLHIAFRVVCVSRC